MTSIPLSEASAALTSTLLIDKVSISKVTGTKTQGFDVVVTTELVAEDVPALIQTIAIASGEDILMNHFSIKVPPYTPLEAGMDVTVKQCAREPGLVGLVLRADQVSYNGLALLRKAIATLPSRVNAEGKDVLPHG